MTEILLISGSRKADAKLLHYCDHIVERAKANNFHIICGDAMGIDSQAWWSAVEKEVPFTVYGTKSTPRNEAPITNYTLFQSVENKSDGRNYTDRDRFMIDKAVRVVCIWNGESKGTLAVAKYALELRKPVWLYTLRNNSVVNITEEIDKL